MLAFTSGFATLAVDAAINLLSPPTDVRPTTVNRSADSAHVNWVFGPVGADHLPRRKLGLCLTCGCDLRVSAAVSGMGMGVIPRNRTRMRTGRVDPKC